MRTKCEIASEKFLEGFNCAQAVFYSYCDDLQFDRDCALKLACGFGAGMGRKQQVCGAVTGGIIIIGLQYGRGERDDRKATEQTYKKTRDLMDRFESQHGTFICRQLLNGCELMTEEGQRTFKENDLMNKTCKEYVRSVVQILQEIL
jgi:C_GCAxxG_C_C family probable redox protein